MEPILRRGLLAGARLEGTAARFGARHGMLLLRLSLGIVLLWFGIPKFVPGLSAADALAQDTIAVLTAHVITGSTATLLLAILETAIGVGLLTGRFLRLTLAALLFQMTGTLTPLVLFPDEMWKAPLVLTLEGQFVVKNLVLIAAALTIAGSVWRADRRGRQGGHVIAPSREAYVETAAVGPGEDCRIPQAAAGEGLPPIPTDDPQRSFSV